MSDAWHGAAVVGLDGRLAAWDDAFARLLGLSGRPPEAFAERPELAMLRAASGPVRVEGPRGPVDVDVVAGAGATLLEAREVSRASRDGSLRERGERAAMVSRVAAGVAHEAKNPLNAISIHLGILADKLRRPDRAGRVPDDQDRHLRAVRDQIGRVDDILRRFADFSAPEPPCDGRYADAAGALRRALALLAYEARCAQIELKAEPGGPAPVEAALRDVDEAMAALLFAGIEATRRCGQGAILEVRLATVDEFVLCRLSLPPGAPWPPGGADAEGALGVAERSARACGGSLEHLGRGVTLRLRGAR